MKVIVEKTWLPHRSMKDSPTTVVLHATAGKSAMSSIAWLRKIGLSYHFIIERDGTIYKLVPLSKQAFHAGVSVGPNGRNCNRYSFGVAFANTNDGEKITDAQESACEELIWVLKGAHPTLEYITTHRLISPGRKTDPKGYDFIPLAKRSKLRPWRKTASHSWV